MKVLVALFVGAALSLALGASGGERGMTDPRPQEIPAPPWAQLPKAEEMSAEDVASQGQVPDLYAYLVDTFGKRFGGHWLSMKAGTMVYNIGLTNPIDADLKLAEELRDKQVPAMRFPIQIVPVPLSEKDLQELYSQFTNQQLKGDLPADLAVETRVDIGRLVIGISQSAADARQIEDEVLAKMESIDPSYSDYIVFYIDDSEGGMFLDRGHIPPYRAGKFAFMSQSPAFDDPDRTTNFVWEDDDSGPPILRGGVAGHCGYDGDPVKDEDFPTQMTWGHIGTSSVFWDWVLNPSTGRQMATGDSAFVARTAILDQDQMKQTVIVGTTVGSDAFIKVVDWTSMQSVAFGTRICLSGASTPYDCGSYSIGPDATSHAIGGAYPQGGTYLIDITHVACATGLSSQPGDSGAPIFLDRTVQGEREAVALGVVSHIRGDHVTRCWDTVGHINATTPNHFWDQF